MRKSLLTTVAVLGLALPAMAQDASTTRSPPSPNGSQFQPQPPNSLPPGAATGQAHAPGTISTTPITPGGATTSDSGDMTGMQPMHHHRHRHAMRHHRMNPDSGEIGPATGGGGGEPASRHASNIDRGDTRGDIAPALPMPPVRGNGPDAYLAAADRALVRRQTGEAQEALERAETRLLDRSVPMGQVGMADHDPRLSQIRDARMALANRDFRAARSSIEQAMNMHPAGDMMGGPGMAPPPGGMAPPPGGMAPPPGGMAPPPPPGGVPQ